MDFLRTTNALTEEIENNFVHMLDEWFSKGGRHYGDDIDEQIAEWNSDTPKVKPKHPYFSPSQLNSCPRELYYKNLGAERDNEVIQPHQGRWQKLGTLGGDLIQRELLMIEKYYEDTVGEPPRFTLMYNEDSTPVFEDFAKKNKEMSVGGKDFYLYGEPDGIMNYVTEDGEQIKVGLEIKSKQTTNARTSAYSMRSAEESHFIQSVAYAEMFDCDYFMIFYINYSKKSWVLSDDEYFKTPDIRAFCYEITKQDKSRAFKKAVDVLEAIEQGTPPKIDLDRYTFNNYKSATVKDLSDEDIAELEKRATHMQNSNAPNWRKVGIRNDVESIKKLREAVK